MRGLGGFFVNAGETVQLNILELSDNIEGAIGVLKKFDEDGGGDVATFTSSQLESDAGAQAELEKAHGYTFVVVPVVNDDGTIKLRLRVISGGNVRIEKIKTVAINNDEPLGFRLVMDEEAAS